LQRVLDISEEELEEIHQENIEKFEEQLAKERQKPIPIRNGSKKALDLLGKSIYCFFFYLFALFFALCFHFEDLKNTLFI
jgi:hypothetical protein